MIVWKSIAQQTPAALLEWLIRGTQNVWELIGGTSLSCSTCKLILGPSLSADQRLGHVRAAQPPLLTSWKKETDVGNVILPPSIKEASTNKMEAHRPEVQHNPSLPFIQDHTSVF